MSTRELFSGHRVMAAVTTGLRPMSDVVTVVVWVVIIAVCLVILYKTLQ